MSPLSLHLTTEIATLHTRLLRRLTTEENEREEKKETREEKKARTPATQQKDKKEMQGELAELGLVGMSVRDRRMLVGVLTNDVSVCALASGSVC
jgi:hypothetical protein